MTIKPRVVPDLTDELGRPLPGVELQPERRTGYDAADPKTVNDAKREEGQRRRARQDALRKALLDPAFREYVWDIMVSCRMFADLRGPTPHDTYAALGERNIGLRLHNDIFAASPDLYLTMRKEALERDRRQEDRNETNE